MSMEAPVCAAGVGAGGGGANTLQAAYEAGSTIAVVTAEGAVTLSNSADATDLMTMARTFAGAGKAIAITMGATTTGHAIELDSATGAAGYHFRGLRNAAQTWAIDADGAAVFGHTVAPGSTGRLCVFGTGSQSILQARLTGSANFEVHGAGYVRLHNGTTLAIGSTTAYSIGSGSGIRCAKAAAGASSANVDGGIVIGNGRRTDTGAVGTDTYVATSGDFAHVTVMSVASPVSGTLDYVELHIRPNFNGTSSGVATAIAVAVDADAWTGGTINLVDLGTSTSDYFTGYTSQFRIDSLGDMYVGSVAAASAIAVAGSVLKASRTLQTTDATVTTIITIPTASDKCYNVVVDVSGLQSGGSAGVGYVRAGTFRNDSGTITQVGTTTSVHTAEDAGLATCDVTIDSSGTNIRVRVTGVAATTIDWKARCRVVEN